MFLELDERRDQMIMLKTRESEKKFLYELKPLQQKPHSPKKSIRKTSPAKYLTCLLLK